jgi:tetratricopeptide (TPR) repeat protein
MSDSVAEIKFIKSVGLAVEEDALHFTHDYGEVILPWDTITHSMLIIWDKKMASHLPLFVMYSNTSDYFYYIDGNTLTLKSLKLGDEAEDASGQSQELVDMKKMKEEGFKKIISEICANAHNMRVDSSVNPYLKGSQAVIPKFTRLKEISDYCVQAIATMADEHFSAEPVSAASGPPRPAVSMAQGSFIEGKYAIKEIIASDTETQYIVFDPDLQKLLALKTLPEQYINDTTMTNLFINQAVMWTRQGSHHNLVKADLFKIIDGVPYIFAEYVHGSTLEDITATESLSVRSAIEIGIQISEALDFGFRQSSIAHRDIRPSTCIITAEDVLKLANYSMARIFDDLPSKGPLSEKCKKLESGEIAVRSFPLYRSLPYMAPELFSNLDAAGIKSDLYSLGVVLYKILANINPFAAESPTAIMRNHLELVPTSLQKLNPKVPEPLAQLIHKCIERDPSRRYDSISQVISELRQIYLKNTGSNFDRPRIEKAMSEDYWINKGLSLRSINRNDDAIKAFDEAIRVNPESLRARFYRGSSLSKRLKEGMKDDPKNWEAWFWKGETQRRSGKSDEALKCFDKALGLDEKQEMIWIQVARLMIDAGKMDNALKSYDRALFHKPGAVDILDYKGNLLLQMKNYQGASDCFREALSINPTYKWALHHQGMALFNLGSYDEAVEILKKVLELDPAFYNAWIRIGDCYREQDKPNEAMQAYQKAIELEPKNMDAYLASIQTLKKAAEWEQAMAFIDRAIENDPSEPSLAFDMADTLFKLGYYRESRTICEKMLTEEPQNDQWHHLFNAVLKSDTDESALFEKISSTPAVPRESYGRNLDGLLSVFCSARDAVAYLEISKNDDARTSFLKACLYFIEGVSDKALTHITKAAADPQMDESVQRMKKRIEESVGKASKVKELLQFAKMLKKKESESDEELLINGLEKMKANKFHEARSLFRDLLTKNPTMYACIYYMARNYESENNNEKAQHYFAEFAKYVPLSIGMLKEKAAACYDSDPGEAELTYLQLIGSYPYNCILWMEYMKFLCHRNDQEKLKIFASGLLRETFNEWEHLRESPLYWSIMGLLQIHLFRNRGAKKSFSKAMEHDGGSPASSFEVADYFEGSAAFQEALTIMRRMLSS